MHLPKPFAFLALALACGAAAAQQLPAQAPAPATAGPTVDRNLTIRGVPLGQIYEQFRPQVGAYLKEIEASGDHANWKLPPSKAFEQAAKP